MKESRTALAVLTALVVLTAIALTGCSKKVAPPPAAAPPAPTSAPAPPPVPAPTVSLTATPSAIEEGQSTTLAWNSTNATEVTVDGGIGTVPSSGSRVIRPSSSTTYKARATGPGGTAEAEVRVTVSAPMATPPPSRPLTDAEFFTTRINDVYFDYDRYDIREDARTTLVSNARALSERASIRVTIEGHCDERGSERYNLALGDRRANAARDFLVGQGIPSTRLDTVSLGENQPFCNESNEDCWQKNRRAHFVMR